MINLIKKWKAKRHNVPYKNESFWPPYYITYGHAGPNGERVTEDIYYTAVGDVVPIFIGAGIKHLYKLKSIGSAAGSDHIVSPRQFNIVYERSERTK